MQYIIDAVQGTIIKGNEESQETVQQQIDKQIAKKYQKFQFCISPVDKSNHANAIVKAMVTTQNEVICFERYSDCIKFYDMDLKYLKKEKLPLHSPGFITSITYDERNKIYGASSTDGYLHFYQ